MSVGLQGGDRPGSEGVKGLGPEEPQKPMEARQRWNWILVESLVT